MRKVPFALALALVAATAQAAPPREWIGQAALPELVVAFHEVGDGSMIVERIPPGETVERWTQMVTTQRFAGVTARGGTLDEWHGYMTGGVARACPGSRSSAVKRLQVAGHAAIEFRAECPLNPATGLPETYLIRAIAGSADLHVAQVAFRHAPSVSEAAWASAHLASVTLCSSDSTAAVCRAGPEEFDR